LTYQPMQELLAYLRANGFKTFIESGGGTDFMRYGRSVSAASRSSRWSAPLRVHGSNDATGNLCWR
jgi:hypothetical protein